MYVPVGGRPTSSKYWAQFLCKNAHKHERNVYSNVAASWRIKHCTADAGHSALLRSLTRWQWWSDSLTRLVSFNSLFLTDRRVYMPKAHRPTRDRSKSLFRESPANRNRLGRNFTGRRRVTWHALLQTFGALRLTGTNGAEKTHFANFCQPNNAKFHPLPSSRCPWNLNTKRESVSSWILLKHNFEIFPEWGNLLRKNIILGFWGKLPARGLRSLGL